MEKHATIIAVLLILVVSGLGGVYFYYSKTLKERNTEKFNAAYGEAKLLHRRGEYDMAIAKFNEAIRYAPTGALQARVKLRIASGMLHGSDMSAYERAVQLYKEIINDQTLPSSIRAGAMNEMAFVFDRTKDAEFVARTVFNEEPYRMYFRESQTGIYGAVRKIYEQSDLLYPTAFAKLQIAAKYAIPLLNRQTEPHLTASQTAGLINKNLDNAVPLMQSLPYDVSTVAYMQLLRATALKAVEPIREDVAVKDVEAAYQEAIVAAGASSDADSKYTLILARLFYAMTLADKFGESRTEDISNLISSLIREEVSFQHLTAYLRYFATASPDDFRKRSLLKISEISPEFRDLLSELGWGI